MVWKLLPEIQPLTVFLASRVSLCPHSPIPVPSQRKGRWRELLRGDCEVATRETRSPSLWDPTVSPRGLKKGPFPEWGAGLRARSRVPDSVHLK